MVLEHWSLVTQAKNSKPFLLTLWEMKNQPKKLHTPWIHLIHTSYIPRIFRDFILSGLNDTYSAVRGQILLMQSLPSVTKVYSTVMQEEKQREVVEHRLSGTSHAMNVASTKSNKSASAKTSNSDKQGSRKPLQCTYCDWTTRTVDRCFFLSGFPPGHKFHGKVVDPPNSSINTTHPFDLIHCDIWGPHRTPTLGCTLLSHYCWWLLTFYMDSFYAFQIRNTRHLEFFLYTSANPS